ncbi:MAG: UvrY/SirA/GacA family response regulator transcription factor [Spongiibacteraceae bacterium]
MSSVTNILLADDHDLVRSGLRRLLADFPELMVVGEAESGEDAFRLCRELKPDLVLMDLKMPGIGGLEATRKITTHFPYIKVLAVSAVEDDLYASRLLQAGASGYLIKGSPFEEMVRAIRKVMAGQRYLSGAVAEQLALRQFDGGEASPFERLSERELQIALMVVNCHKVQDISEQLNLSPKTVNSYRYRLFEKLGIESDVELTHMAIKYGMVESQRI